MPQMMPLNWMMLFIITNLIFSLFLILSFYNHPMKMNSYNKNLMYNKNDTKFIHNFWPIY
uniref:ATP synthase complex subunit 8 n=1 Tax=Lepidostoma longipilosum TaxID=2904889 RepID=A0A9E8LNI0_9NEOP|nr:ATP synthase F0 subunit 8 [Lepidostoma longipilosum]UZZ43639.1 ATP synthase F0 subunit 8 [Lepidostoma longipilosum]